MLKKKALYFYNNGYNCSQCLLKGAEQIYGIVISEQAMRMCSAINTGFGIDSICSVLVSGIMLFGIMFDDETAKRLRIKLLDEFHSNHNTMSCGKLNNSKYNNGGCLEVIGAVADIVENIIKNEKNY